MSQLTSVLPKGKYEASISLDKLASNPNVHSWLIDEGGPFERSDFWRSDKIDLSIAENGRTFESFEFKTGFNQPIQAVECSDVTLVGADGIAFAGSHAIYDTCFEVAWWEPQSQVSHCQQGVSFDLQSEIKIRNLSSEYKYFLGYNGRYLNYCHWMQQLLPWHIQFTKLKRLFPKLRLLLPHIQSVTYGMQTLDLLGISLDDVEFIATDEAVHMESAIVCGRIDLWHAPAALVAGAHLLRDQVGSSVGPAEKIYVHRNVPRRNLANFSDHLPFLLEAGFKIIECENLTVDEQIRTFRSAKHIVAEHGAALINLIFCDPGTTVLELFNPACVQPAFWSVASAFGLKYGFIVGEHHPVPGLEIPEWNSHYTVTPAKLRDAITLMMSV